MQILFKVVCISIAISCNGIFAGDDEPKEISVRSIDSNSKSSDQPFRVNLSCK